MDSRNKRRVIGAAVLKKSFVVAVGMSLAACGAFLPNAGPTTQEIIGGDPEQTLDFAIAELDVQAVTATQTPAPAAFDLNFRGTGIESAGVIGVGDLLSVSIWENLEDGLFTSAGSKQAVIPSVRVDEDGTIAVPYVGRIRAAGLRPFDIQEAIRKRLEEQTLQPEVLVGRAEIASRAVTVQGSIGAPGVYPLTLHQDRLLSLLASAGLSADAEELTEVTIRRGDASASGWLDMVYEDPGANLALRSGDTIIVNRRNWAFNAFGAVGRTGRQQFQTRDMSLLDAISAMGGLNAQNANPTGVFLFRREEPAVLSQLTRLDETAHGLDDELLARFDGPQPVVYQLELNRSEALFLAGEFKMRDGDTIYVTEAPYAAWRKVLSVIIPTLGTAGSVSALSATMGN